MNTLKFLLIITFFSFLHLPPTPAADISTVKSVCILGECQESDIWQKFLRQNGIPDADIINWNTFKQEKKEIGSLIIHNTSITDPAGLASPDEAETILKEFINNGGRLLSAEKAGCINGNFLLKNILKTGNTTITLPILYPEYIAYDQDKLTAMAKHCITNGANGIALFEFVALNIHRWKPKKNDFTPTVKKIFSSLESWEKKQDSPVPLGLPETCKAIYVSGGWMTGSRFTTSPRELAQYAHETGINIICTTVWGKNGPLYDSEYLNTNAPVPQKSEESKNYLPGLIEECKKYNIQVWATIHPMKVDLVTPACSTLQISNGGIISKKICPVSAKEYYEKMLIVVGELLEKHPYINVLALDEPGLGGGKKDKWRCFCPNCKKLFYQKYGKELSNENVINEKNGEKISREFKEFREDIMVEFYFKPLKQTIDKVRSGIQLLIWNPIGQELGAINPQKLADNGINIIFGTEFQTKIDGPCQNKLRYKAQYFEFDSLLTEGRELKTAGQGLKVDIFNGATVIAQMKKGKFKYPAIVSANDNNTLYFCFNPVLYNNNTTILLIKNFLQNPKHNILKN